MRISEAINKVQEEVIDLLCKAGLLQGDLLDIDEIKERTETMFWYKKVATLEASKKNLFVIWNVLSAEPIGKANDKVAIRRVIVSIDVYSQQGEINFDTKSLISKIDNIFTKNEWGFEKAAYDSIDNVDNKLQLRFEATKKI